MHRIWKIKLFRLGGWPGGWVAGSAEIKAISAFNLVEVEVEVEAELGKKVFSIKYFSR